MRVENPRFNDHLGGKVYCVDCPFADEHGVYWCASGCGGTCPTESTYQSACLMAEEAKGGKG